MWCSSVLNCNAVGCTLRTRSRVQLLLCHTSKYPTHRWRKSGNSSISRCITLQNTARMVHTYIQHLPKPFCKEHQEAIRGSGSCCAAPTALETAVPYLTTARLEPETGGRDRGCHSAGFSGHRSLTKASTLRTQPINSTTTGTSAWPAQSHSVVSRGAYCFTVA